MSIRLITTTESSQRSKFDVRPQCCLSHTAQKRFAPSHRTNRGTATSHIMCNTTTSQASPCTPLTWLVDPRSCRGAASTPCGMRTWPAVARQLPLRLDRPQEHNELSALSQSAAKVGAVADGEPDDASRGQAASCRTDARSAVIAAATVHGMQARGWAAHGLSQSCTP